MAFVTRPTSIPHLTPVASCLTHALAFKVKTAATAKHDVLTFPNNHTGSLMLVSQSWDGFCVI